MTLDSMDKQLLNIIQSNLPIDPEPYRKLAEILGTTEEDILGRLKRLIEKGVIRRLGAIFDSRKVGYCGTLCAMKVPEDRIEEVVAVVNSFPGVTHNYLRDHPYNIWFTLLVESQVELENILQEIKKRTGISDMLNLPASRIFKILVNFDLGEDDDA
ncbi:DNA-binding transcriptional regulator, Lrp family [Desulfofundulus australicus DSM 11792]|uniref:siroheme decarboxylase n=1 Tax=Desulfofundulus australicus DSM 11792 TaxID=1121425 RepID=A0A1M5DF60_9FIRM|nr:MULTISPECIES: AsnC family transcriptional regulator [Desulfofundulus]SHF65322.1 DNA-binding transcriptional regulator, Lrp family [Desulfofundulus australicus DSM 11792]